MARLSYVSDAASESTPAGAIYREIVTRRGKVLNYYRTLANQPAALRAFMDMSRYIREDSGLAPKLRELAILVTALELGSEYEYVHHVEAGRKAGLSETKLASVRDFQSSQVFDTAEQAVMGYAQEVGRSRCTSDATFAALQNVLSDAEIVDLALTVGWYHLGAAFLGGLNVELEE